MSVVCKKIIGKYCWKLNFIKKTVQKKSLPRCLKTPEAEILIWGYWNNMRFYLVFVVKFFGEEDAQRFFINRLAEAVADEEAQQGKADA